MLFVVLTPWLRSHEGSLTVGIKQVPQGVFSTHANEVIKVEINRVSHLQKAALFMSPTVAKEKFSIAKEEAESLLFFPS